MIVAFAAFVALLMEFFDIAGARVAFPIALASGAASIAAWILFGDLRAYLIVRAAPIVLLLVGLPIRRDWLLFGVGAG